MTAAPGLVEQVAGTDKTFRVALQSLDGGLNTRAYPHTLQDRFLSVADNAVFLRDGLVSKRPGNAYYGGSVNGATGGGSAILSLARFYPASGSPILVAQSGVNLYSGNDGTGAFTLINGGMTAGARAQYCQMFDPDMTSGAAPALFICDGKRIPQQWDGTNFVPVQTGGTFLPNSPTTGLPIKPKYCCDWGYHMVYAGDDSDPTGLYIADALRPQRFTGTSYVDSATTSYIPFYPAGRSGKMGNITGLVPMSADTLLVFFTNGIVTCTNTGSYGAFEFAFTILSRSVGCPSPYSIVPFDSFCVFFGGDRFYAASPAGVYPLPDRVPTIYARNAQSAYPPEIYDITKVVAVRHNTQYIASYPTDAGLINNRCAVFDTAAAGGYIFGFFPRGYDETNGGAWSRWLGMNLNCAVECRGPGDTYQLFWGGSDADYVAQHDTGTYDDFGNDITFEVRGKAISLDKLYAPKYVHSMYVVMVFDTRPQSYTSTLLPYVVRDQLIDDAPTVSVVVSTVGVKYGGGATYGGSTTYQSSQQTLQSTLKVYPAQPTAANSITPGLIEKSKNPINLIGFALEMTCDDPY